MTATITNNILYLEDQWILDLVASTADLTISTTYNCGETVTVSLTAGDIVDDQYSINVEEGPYYIVLTNITDPNNIQTKTLCAVNLTEETQCKVADKIEEKCNENLASYYVALQLVNNCSECTCEKACSIYEEILNILNNGCNC